MITLGPVTGERGGPSGPGAAAARGRVFLSHAGFEGSFEFVTATRFNKKLPQEFVPTIDGR